MNAKTHNCRALYLRIKALIPKYGQGSRFVAELKNGCFLVQRMSHIELCKNGLAVVRYWPF